MFNNYSFRVFKGFGYKIEDSKIISIFARNIEEAAYFINLELEGDERAYAIIEK